MVFEQVKRKSISGAIAAAVFTFAPISAAHAQCSDFSNDINALDQLMAIACGANDQFGEDDSWIAAGCDLWGDLGRSGYPNLYCRCVESPRGQRVLDHWITRFGRGYSSRR